MIEVASKVIWCIGVVGWFIIRQPYARRSRRRGTMLVVSRRMETLLLAISASGLGLVPALYVFAGAFRFADYPEFGWRPWLGGAIFAFALWMFRRSHSDLGSNWSVTLEVKENHNLVTGGVYTRIRHPMYAAFWLWAIAQAVLLPNWIAGPAGLIGFGTLYFVRVPREEAMMVEIFGDQFRAYMSRTKRIIPYVL